MISAKDFSLSAPTHQELGRARLSRAAIERLYIEMRHLFNTGAHGRLGAEGEVLTDALLTLSPEIYGSMADPEVVELEGLVYIMDRLPKGIEECRNIKLISEEGYSESGFEPLVPAARRRKCYRIDEDQMHMEITLGRSEIYDILTHLTFMYIEARKIMRHVTDANGQTSREWKKLEAIVTQDKKLTTRRDFDQAFSYLSSILGRSFAETQNAYDRLNKNPDKNNGLFHIVYWLGHIAHREAFHQETRLITFSPLLRERIGHHIYGERWAERLQTFLLEKNWLNRPLHIISANMHSVMNAIYAYPALRKVLKTKPSIEELAIKLSRPESSNLRTRVEEYALTHGMHVIHDSSGTNISVQIFDLDQIDLDKISPEVGVDKAWVKGQRPLLLVMDYAFGEQAYETMDELLKELKANNTLIPMPVSSVSIMGKAGILTGGKGDIMIPTAHIFEGTADNYPIQNDFSPADFPDDVPVFEGAMITVLGTSLQNRDVLEYFMRSSWRAVGLEMEGAHYQKAIQAAARIRRSIREDVVIRYAYYASDNPLITGSTLASGSLGLVGVRPTYLITLAILRKILRPPVTASIAAEEVSVTA
jgi:hypothetical protein